MTNKEINDDAINAKLFGNDQKIYQDLFGETYTKQFDVNHLGYVNTYDKTKNIVNPDKLVKYQFKFDNSISAQIPLKYAYRAKKLLDLTLESDSIEEFENKVSLYPSLKGVYISKKVKEFLKYYYDYKLHDLAYLETCLHLAYDDLSKNNVGDDDYKGMEGGLERLQKIKNVENINGVLKILRK